MYGNHFFTFLYRTCRLSSIWVENGAHFGRFATKAWRISKKHRRVSRGLLVRRPAKGGRAGGQPGPRFPGIGGFPRLRGFPSPRVFGGMPGFPFPISSSICFPTLWDHPSSILFHIPVWIFFSIFLFYYNSFPNSFNTFGFYVFFYSNFLFPLCSPCYVLLYLVYYSILLSMVLSIFFHMAISFPSYCRCDDIRRPPPAGPPKVPPKWIGAWGDVISPCLFWPPFGVTF